MGSSELPANWFCDAVWSRLGGVATGLYAVSGVMFGKGPGFPTQSHKVKISEIQKGNGLSF